MSSLFILVPIILLSICILSLFTIFNKNKYTLVSTWCITSLTSLYVYVVEYYSVKNTLGFVDALTTGVMAITLVFVCIKSLEMSR